MSQVTHDVRGRTVTTFELGTGRPIVYLHGFADVHGVSADLLSFHAELARAGRLIAPAHPGINGSDELTDGSTLTDAVFHYLELLDALKLTTFDLVGHCLGGWLAAEIATLVPERVRSLSLIGACGLLVPGQPTGDIFMLALPERGVDFAALRAMLFATAEAEPALRYFPDGRSETEEEVRRYQTLRFASFIGFRPPYLYNPALGRRLHRATIPTAVIWGAHDRFVPSSHGQAYVDQLPSVEHGLKIVPSAGHAAPMEQSVATAELVLAHLHQHPA